MTSWCASDLIPAKGATVLIVAFLHGALTPGSARAAAIFEVLHTGAAVPEPSALLLILGAIILLAGLLWRRGRHGGGRPS